MMQTRSQIAISTGSLGSSLSFLFELLKCSPIVAREVLVNSFGVSMNMIWTFPRPLNMFTCMLGSQKLDTFTDMH